MKDGPIRLGRTASLGAQAGWGRIRPWRGISPRRTLKSPEDSGYRFIYASPFLLGGVLPPLAVHVALTPVIATTAMAGAIRIWVEGADARFAYYAFDTA